MIVKYTKRTVTGVNTSGIMSDIKSGRKKAIISVQLRVDSAGWGI